MNLKFLKWYSLCALPALVVGVIIILVDFGLMKPNSGAIPKQYCAVLVLLFIFNVLYALWIGMADVDDKFFLSKFGETKISWFFSSLFLVQAAFMFHKDDLSGAFIYIMLFASWEFNRRIHKNVLENIRIQNAIKQAKGEQAEEVQLS